MRTKLISVVGTDIITAMNEQGVVYIAMKPLIEGMGLDWGTQSRKLGKDSRYSHMTIPYQTQSGIQEMVSLDADHLPAFLYSINPNKVRKDLRDKIIAFQNETFAVINSYWRGKQKPNSELEDIIMAQNATIANQQRQLESKKIEDKPKKHPKSGLNPVDHNTLLELIYQFSVHKQNLRTRIMADLDTEGNIENFLIGVGNRYPELKEYIDKHSESMEHLQLHFNGMTPNWDKVKKIAEGL